MRVSVNWYQDRPTFARKMSEAICAWEAPDPPVTIRVEMTLDEAKIFRALLGATNEYNTPGSGRMFADIAKVV